MTRAPSRWLGAAVLGAAVLAVAGGVAANRSRVVFHGGIHIREGADGTDANLSNKNLLLSADAEIDTQPTLVIDADDAVYTGPGERIGALDYEAVPALGDYDRPGTPGFCIAIHAEVNALLFATRDTKGATAYITDPPCPGCRKALAAAGIVRAVWPGGEHDRAGLTTWT